MKKLILTILFTLVLSGGANASIIEVSKCLKNKYSYETNWYDLSDDIEDIIFSSNFSTGVLTWTEIYTPNTSIKNITGEKKTRETLFFSIETYTKKEIIARSYLTDNPTLRQIMLNPNDNTAIHREIIINLEKNTVTEIVNPGGQFVFDTNKFDWLDKKINKERITIYLCQSNEGDSDDEKGAGSSGTAFFVSNKGHLLTNNHVVDGCKVSKITYQDKDYDTQLLATDKTLDLALLKADLRNKSYLNFSGDEAKKMQKIYVGGYPLGKGLSDDLKISSGIVSSLKGFEDNSNEIQIDAAINPGNSGGPIINEDGELVAIAVSGMSKDKTEGINFGIKASAAERFLKSNDLKASSSFFSSSKNNDELLEILEEATVYTYCN
jgi:S1-C subfamily serine protease